MYACSHPGFRVRNTSNGNKRRTDFKTSRQCTGGKGSTREEKGWGGSDLNLLISFSKQLQYLPAEEEVGEVEEGVKHRCRLEDDEPRKILLVPVTSQQVRHGTARHGTACTHAIVGKVSKKTSVNTHKNQKKVLVQYLILGMLRPPCHDSSAGT